MASALYLSDQLGKAVDRTTGELIPMTSVALSLSERSAILVASASGLVLSVDISILQQRSERLDALLREIDNSVLYLEQHASHLVTGQLRQDVRRSLTAMESEVRAVSPR
ncbi:hypothetical protein [Candidatus Reidiella endopervernicosa]|uniref:Uncharacterized protein n=1 Tax=Candidatus Reidiella endopervernicosa TaxID=2738883 RepID=A0A6N0HZW0_9GAMM|nr:hypothetical protein [Candidatus Reidiella endopervernicosa]QKQ27761.1 hypothetical protein HUE57_16820 [Candidatus Reidiella endopervernicosa]